MFCCDYGSFCLIRNLQSPPDLFFLWLLNAEWIIQRPAMQTGLDSVVGTLRCQGHFWGSSGPAQEWMPIADLGSGWENTLAAAASHWVQLRGRRLRSSQAGHEPMVSTSCPEQSCLRSETCVRSKSDGDLQVPPKPTWPHLSFLSWIFFGKSLLPN